MNESIKVSIVEFADRPYYQMQYRDPITGKKKTKSTRVRVTGRKRERTEAERVAAKWEADLREGRYKATSAITWAEFRERYETEVVSGLADATAVKVCSIFNTIENLVSPNKLAALDAQRISNYVRLLREGSRAEDTIAGHLSHLRSALAWAKSQKMIAEIPEIRKPKRAKGGKSMKGRPITGEEFDRLIAKVGAIVGDDDPQQPSIETKCWRHLLRGLWCSGLRIGEAVQLSWDGDTGLLVDLSHKYPMLLIPAEAEKGNRDRLLPMAPEFAELLMETPQLERTGYVFDFPPYSDSRRVDSVSRKICRIGKAAGVKVQTTANKKKGESAKIKYASAHDLRRSFGFRWASRIMPPQLMELMRHESISTTMKFYVGRNAENTASILWDAHKIASDGNSLGNSPDSEEKSESEEWRFDPQNKGRNK